MSNESGPPKPATPLVARVVVIALLVALALLIVVLSNLGASGAPAVSPDTEEREDVVPTSESADGVQAVVQKSRRRMYLLREGQPTRCFRIALGSSPEGDKLRMGDGRTPVGTFYVCQKNEDSKYFLFIGLSYPGAEHAARGLDAGLISEDQNAAILGALAAHKTPPWYTRLGGEIGFHGGGASWDWTRGCVALDNADMRELYAALRVGAIVRIEP